MSNLFEGDFYPGQTKNTTLVKAYKTSSGDFYKIQGNSFIIETPGMLEDGYIMSPGQNQFFRECLRKPVYCDMSNGGIGRTYVFCETTQTLAVLVANLSVSDSSYSFQYRLYEMFANEMPESDISLVGLSPSHTWSNSGSFNNRPISTEPLYSASSVGPEYIYCRMFITKSSSRRISNKYNVCYNKPVVCQVEISLIPNDSVNQESNPFGSSFKHSVSFPITSLVFDRGMYLVGCGGYTDTDSRKVVGAIDTSPIYLDSTLSTTFSNDTSSSTISVIYSNINVINNTQQVLGFGFSAPEISALEPFSSNLGRPSRPSNPLNQLGGWAAYFFTGANVSVSFSDTVPGSIMYSAEPQSPFI